MSHLVPLLDFHTAVRPAEIVEAHRQPTHPTVIPWCFRKGEGLAHLALIAQTTGAGVTLDHTRVHQLVTQEIPHMRKTGFAMYRSSFNAIHPTTYVGLFGIVLDVEMD